MLNQLLEQKKVSKYRLWKDSGVPQSTISDICTGKTRIEKCSAETIFRLAKALGVSMEDLITSAMEEKDRPAFELFRSNVCHRVKDMGDVPFLIDALSNDFVKKLYNKKWYPEALYLLAMIDYISRVNDVPLCTNYDDLRKIKLENTIYPTDVTMLCTALHTDAPKKQCMQTAIPEFLRFNIVECEVRDVC